MGMDPAEIYMQGQAQRKGIASVGIVSGICAIAYTVLQIVIPWPITHIRFLYRIYFSNGNFENILLIFLSVFSLLMPFAIGGLWLKKKNGKDPFIFEKPKDPYISVLAVAFGVFVCLAGNWIASMITLLSESAGFELTAPEYSVPSGVPGRILYTVAIAVVPALAEETAFRGVVLQHLRPYGDSFAIVMSSAVFAILHGNLIQAPFAMIVGLSLGYICCLTNSLWPSIAVHCINNLYSVATEFMLEDVQSEEQLNKIYYGTFFFLLIISVIGSVIFFICKGNLKIRKRFSYLTTGQKLAAFFLNVPMIIAILIMLKITSEFVTRV